MNQLLRVVWIVAGLIMAGIPAMAQPAASVSGKVLGYLANRVGDYDGLRVQTTTGETHLYFPPHTAARIRRLAVVGQPIKAIAEPGPPGPGRLRPTLDRPPEAPIESSTVAAYRLIEVRNAAGTSFRVSDSPPPLPQPGGLVQTEGPLLEKMLDERGQLCALLTDKYLIELRPHQSEQISSLITGVQRLGAAGFERSPDGFVNRTGRPVLRPTSLTIRGQTFAL